MLEKDKPNHGLTRIFTDFFEPRRDIGHKKAQKAHRLKKINILCILCFFVANFVNLRACLAEAGYAKAGASPALRSFSEAGW